jgi:hypothetical protein
LDIDPLRHLWQDSLRDFEHVMTVLQHGAQAHYDAASFVSACANFSAQMDNAELEGWWQESMTDMSSTQALQRQCAPFVCSVKTAPSCFTQYQLATVASRFFEEWKVSTGLSEVPEDDIACEMPLDSVDKVLVAILPGLEAHQCMRERLLIALTGRGKDATPYATRSSAGLEPEPGSELERANSSGLRTVGLAAFCNGLSELSAAATVESRTEVCFRCFQDDSGNVDAAQIQSIFQQLCASLRAASVGGHFLSELSTMDEQVAIASVVKAIETDSQPLQPHELWAAMHTSPTDSVQTGRIKDAIVGCFSLDSCVCLGPSI